MEGMDDDQDDEEGDDDMGMEVADEGAVPDRGNNASRIMQAHAEAVFCLAIDKSQRFFVTGGQDDLALVWSFETWQPLQTLKGHKDSVTAVGFSPDSAYVATGAMDGEIKIWNVNDGEEVVSFDCGDDLKWLQWHPSAKFLLAGNAAGAVMMWSVPGGSMSYFSGHTDAITEGCWLPSGRGFLTTAEDGTLIQWSPKTQDIVSKYDGRDNMFHQCPISAVACHEDNTLVATGGAEGAVKLINLKNNRVLFSFENHGDNVETVAFSHSKPSLLATGGLDGKIFIYTVDHHELRQTLEHEGPVVKVLWHPTLPVLYSCSVDGTIRVWDGRTGEQLHMCVGHRNHVLDFDISRDGFGILSVSEDTTIMYFQIRSSGSHSRANKNAFKTSTMRKSWASVSRDVTHTWNLRRFMNAGGNKTPTPNQQTKVV
ncbi:uncharacterized protein MONBRDRAFT_32300 [Monosiga brevicollis MX1]|uniref:Anaphase-promoting complex subunit 4 WD40 domain-containing protein n=1 Tax=Monosiga brevicollis TaxID=81824 RepID=A9UYN6_MONBE|nr:uncharacterized protein MONBRDRAFT_32300 [Monosiga brevicollis MX1]EDQ89496.1 predicted protein [Monosiga brevicollis MX1]|eukprot:XP_001745525.1 hypothetical protein [Monosiga brevicollis MX1]